MKVRHQIAGFSGAQAGSGLKPASVSMCKLGLLALGPTWTIPPTLTPARVNELGRCMPEAQPAHR